ncbi:hypothetical protein Anapl_08839 [Anas platyrhynchos]|uniref:Uncharacterized protein n=1 Tax=Anas platyrhynchos TaxID=8839 RepID=R0L6J5_ANAPL|nr:hypothetical protein Anapl_08839 [Anas platyrhynchos]
MLQKFEEAQEYAEGHIKEATEIQRKTMATPGEQHWESSSSTGPSDDNALLVGRHRLGFDPMEGEQQGAGSPGLVLCHEAVPGQPGTCCDRQHPQHHQHQAKHRHSESCELHPGLTAEMQDEEVCISPRHCTWLGASSRLSTQEQPRGHEAIQARELHALVDACRTLLSCKCPSSELVSCCLLCWQRYLECDCSCGCKGGEEICAPPALTALRSPKCLQMASCSGATWSEGMERDMNETPNNEKKMLSFKYRRELLAGARRAALHLPAQHQLTQVSQLLPNEISPSSAQQIECASPSEAQRKPNHQARLGSQHRPLGFVLEPYVGEALPLRLLLACEGKMSERAIPLFPFLCGCIVLLVKEISAKRSLLRKRSSRAAAVLEGLPVRNTAQRGPWVKDTKYTGMGLRSIVPLKHIWHLPTLKPDPGRSALPPAMVLVLVHPQGTQCSPSTPPIPSSTSWQGAGAAFPSASLQTRLTNKMPGEFYSRASHQQCRWVCHQPF